eukprot:803493-Pyramimonas_sp.AAC.1
MGIYRPVLLLLANTWEYTGRCSSYWPKHGNIHAGAPPIGQNMGIYRQVLLLLAKTWEYRLATSSLPTGSHGRVSHHAARIATPPTPSKSSTNNWREKSNSPVVERLNKGLTAFWRTTHLQHRHPPFSPLL